MSNARILTLGFLTLGVMVWPATVRRATAIPHEITYQGLLLDKETGEPLDGTFDFVFKLFDDPNTPTGIQVGDTVAKTDLEVSAGLVTAVLDFGDDSAIFNGDARWLEIGLRPAEPDPPGAYTILNPRQEMTSAPYARYALVAGSVVSHDRPDIVYDSDWLAMPMRTELCLDLGKTDFDFVFPWMHAWSPEAGETLRPLLAAVQMDYAPGYVSLYDSVLTIVGYNYLAASANLGDRDNVLITDGNVRYIGVKRTATYDTDWFPCNSNQNYIFSHNCGVFPRFALLEVAQHPDGGGWRVPTMSSVNYGDGGWLQTAIVALDSSQVIVRTQSGLARFRNTASGTVQSPHSGYARLRLWDWQPDYDSGWTAISTAAGDRDKWLKHDLGQTPRLAMLYLSEYSDGSGWVIPAMSPYQVGNSYGTLIYNMTPRWAVIKGGSNSLARFMDRTTSVQNPTSGYFRFLAWK